MAKTLNGPHSTYIVPNSAGISLCLLLLFFIFLSCNKDKTVSPDSGEITLSSRTIGTSPYYIMGYSFEKQVFFQSISAGSEIDIYLNELLVPSGDLDGVQFSTNTISGTVYGFFKNAEFSDLKTAEEYYTNYTSAISPVYEKLTDTISKYDVYTFRTWKGNYVKFMVKNIYVTYQGSRPDYMDVEIKYFIQRDGTADLKN